MGAETGKAGKKDVPGREREVGRAGPVWSTAQGSGLQVGLRVREAGRIRPRSGEPTCDSGPGVEVFLEARDGALPLTLVQGLSRGTH